MYVLYYPQARTNLTSFWDFYLKKNYFTFTQDEKNITQSDSSHNILW